MKRDSWLLGLFFVSMGYLAASRIAEGELFFGLAFLALVVLSAAVWMTPLPDMAARRAPTWGPRILQIVLLAAVLLMVYASRDDWNSIL